MDYKTIISVICVILTFVGYAPYIYDVFKKKTTPHAFTWFIWGLAGLIAWSLQVFGGAGVGAWPLLAASLACVFIFILSLRIGNKDIVATDIIFLILSLVSLFLWLVIKQPVWSAILITLVEVLGFVPTVRKSWNSPHTETLFTFELGAFRHGISILSLRHINILTTFYPAVWTIVNIIFSINLIVRRSVVKKVNQEYLSRN